MKICLNCDETINENREKRKFCCRSCAATYNNKQFIKRKKKTHKCKTCEAEISFRIVYCKDCRKKGKHFKYGKLVEDTTIKEILNRSVIKANRYRAVRQHAIFVMESLNIPKICSKCGYDKHVEISHIKAISNFDLKTKIKIINNPSNLVYLCPNCHWEYDHT